MPKRTPRCPQCQSTNTVPIVWGLPLAGLFEAAERGEVVLGGCCVTDHDPHWHCKDCGTSFN